MKTNLLRKAFSISFKSEFFSRIAPSFGLLLVTTSLIASFFPSLFILELAGGLLFFPILMACLRSHDNNSSFSMPELALIAKKSWKVFIASLISSLIILVGFIFFIIPGIILSKKYLYVGIVSEKEMIGPLDSMKKSAELSEKNGWRLYGRIILLCLICIPLSILAFYTGERIGITAFIGQLPLLWMTYITCNSLIFYGYKEALD